MKDRRTEQDDRPKVRRAGTGDAADVARLLHDFNTEFSDPSPGVGYLSERLRGLLADGEITVFLAGGGPDGFALMRFRPSLWADGPDAYLEELYVAPPLRGRGLGKALLGAAIEGARDLGAVHFDIVTGENEAAARGLYERFGFTNREREPDGPAMLYYELEL